MDVLKILPLTANSVAIFILIMTRIAVFFGSIIVLRKYIFQVKILLAFSVVISFLIVTTMHFSVDLIHQSSLSLFLSMIDEVINGFVCALLVNFMFDIFIAAGQMISMWIGLSSAAFIDPALGGVTDISRFYIYLIIVIFLMSNQHLRFIYTLSHGFEIFPPGTLMLHLFDHSKQWVRFSGYIISFGLMLSFPVMTTLLLVNFSLAISSRFSPQLSIFSVGISLLIITGMFLLYLSFNWFVSEDTDLLNKFSTQISTLILRGSHGR